MGDADGKWVIRDRDKEYVVDSWPTLVEWVREHRLSPAAHILDPRSNQWVTTGQIEVMAGLATAGPRSTTKGKLIPMWILAGAAILVAAAIFYYFVFFVPKQAEIKRLRQRANAVELDLCLSDAESRYTRMWQANCVDRGLGTNCSLPGGIADRLNDLRERARAECYKKYPQ